MPHKGTVGSNPTLSARGLGESTRLYKPDKIGYVSHCFLCHEFPCESKKCGISGYANEVVLGGEVAVPCHPQSATAGLNPS